MQAIEDEISSTIYGANINRMLRLKSPRYKLEDYLITKVDNINDNISNYYVEIDDHDYKIIAVTRSKIDIERL